MKVRLNKFLAECGLASRRSADSMIEAGKVTIDGRRAALGASVDPDRNAVAVNGRRVRHDAFADQLTLVLNKPAGIITTMSDEHGRKTVAQFLPAHRRLFPVGRLDADTTGLLLCTTDGALARLLMHPSSNVPKRYDVIARGSMNPATIAALGARDYARQPDGSHRFTIVLSEGKNRQVRRMCARQGLRVLSLTRTQFGPVRLGRLKAGCTRALSESELRELGQLRAERM
ncbi:MAG: rRNA pseudouridine synthase [Candidatus Eremiobacteraeota bacterium]|nr:rRNA pseudouridine synthase [Candidatus Eremiobacteraeota bacterium]